jgi:hypothetical protein
MATHLIVSIAQFRYKSSLMQRVFAGKSRQKETTLQGLAHSFQLSGGVCVLALLSNNWINPKKSAMFQQVPTSDGAVRSTATGGEERFSVNAVFQFLTGGCITKNRTSKYGGYFADREREIQNEMCNLHKCQGETIM